MSALTLFGVTQSRLGDLRVSVLSHSLPLRPDRGSQSVRYSEPGRSNTSVTTLFVPFGTGLLR